MRKEIGYSGPWLLNLETTFLFHKWFEIWEKTPLINYLESLFNNNNKFLIADKKCINKTQKTHICLIKLNKLALAGNEAHLSVVFKMAPFSYYNTSGHVSALRTAHFAREKVKHMSSIRYRNSNYVAGGASIFIPFMLI